MNASRAWLAGTLLAGGIYLGCYLDRMWYPHDEGALGQTAERVLAGEVPHRDFDEPYTGLLTYVHAAAFAVLGIRLPVLRVPLFLVTILWLVAVFRIALRSTGPPGAAAVTLVALAWSVPNYPASMPSWYNLFFATFGVAALLRWDETRRPLWLVLAGMAGGVSFLFKLPGLFFLAGGGLFLLYATREPRMDNDSTLPASRSPLTASLISVALLLLVLLLWRSVSVFAWVRVFYHFVLPVGVIALALAYREWRPPLPAALARLGGLLRAGLPFLAGAAIPLLVFAAGFALADGLPALVHGVFVAPFRRLAFANMRPPATYWALAAAPLVLLLRPRPNPAARGWRGAGLLLAALLAVLLWYAAVASFPHRFVWFALRSLTPILAVVAALAIAWPRVTGSWAPGSVSRFGLLATVTAFASLIQFPFSSPIYFLYVAPLLLLTVVVLVRGIGGTPAPLAGATLGFFGLFAVLLVTPGAVEGMGFSAVHAPPMAVLELPRAGLTVKRHEAELYGGLIPELQARAGPGPIWAGPDAPEVYFLGGFRNRSRAIFDFLAGDTGRTGMALLSQLAGVRAVVLNRTPLFSPALSQALVDSLRARFPEGREVGHFELRWRN